MELESWFAKWPFKSCVLPWLSVICSCVAFSKSYHWDPRWHGRALQLQKTSSFPLFQSFSFSRTTPQGFGFSHNAVIKQPLFCATGGKREAKILKCGLAISRELKQKRIPYDDDKMLAAFDSLQELLDKYFMIFLLNPRVPPGFFLQGHFIVLLKHTWPQSRRSWGAAVRFCFTTSTLKIFSFLLQAVYMFYALAIVCDDFFVPSLEKICEVRY